MDLRWTGPPLGYGCGRKRRGETSRYTRKLVKSDSKNKEVQRLLVFSPRHLPHEWKGCDRAVTLSEFKPQPYALPKRVLGYAVCFWVWLRVLGWQASFRVYRPWPCGWDDGMVGGFEGHHHHDMKDEMQKGWLGGCASIL